MTSWIIEDISLTSGRVRLRTDGAEVLAPSPAEVEFCFPAIGRPHFPQHVGGGDVEVLPEGLVLRLDEGGSVESVAALVARALQGRIALVATADPAHVVPLTVGTPRPGADGWLLPLLGSPAERQLYDIALRAGTVGWEVVAPHAVYYRSAWSDFGLAHISDLHVARRIDRFRPLLRELGLAEAAERMCSMNDQLRGFIRFANTLHEAGELDVIMATGDLIDYEFEDDDDRAGTGNAGFLRDLILGRAPGPDCPVVEELRVPILMMAGNHDYRRSPYHLVFDVSVAGADLSRVRNFSNLALLEKEAMALTNALSFPGSSEVPDVGQSAAMAMVAVDPALRPFQEALAPREPHVVALGKHRLVLLDSAHDVGMPGSAGDAVWEKIKDWWGSGDEDFTTLVGGSPNCEGIDATELAVAVEALESAPADGLVILGLHAPLTNIWQGDTAPFLRETERPHQPDQVRWWLARHTGLPLAQLRREHGEWLGPQDGPEPAYLKRGDSRDLLDFGVSRGHSDDLLRAIAGVGTSRRADVVLAGHTHRHSEMSVRRLEGDTIGVFTDFYTANPCVWYPSKVVRREDIKAGPDDRLHLPTTTTYVEVDTDAVPGAVPWPMPIDVKHEWIVRTPPYADPLDQATDLARWWDHHKPLLLQTGALGLWENNQISFSGLRLIRVRADVIERIDFLPRERLDAHGWRLSLADAAAPEPPRAVRLLPRTRELGSGPASSPPCVLLPPGGGVHSLVCRQGDGLLVEMWDAAQGRGAGVLAPEPVGGRVSGRPTGLVGEDGTAVVIYRGEDGHVHSLYWSGSNPAAHDALSASCEAPTAAGVPMGYTQPGYTHVVYRSSDGHLHELWWPGAEAVSHGRLTGGSGVPLAGGDPYGYAVAGSGLNIVLYRGVDACIHSLYWTSGAPGHDNLSGFCQAPPAASDPVGLYLPHLDAHNVVYRDHRGGLQLIWWAGSDPAAAGCWTEVAGAPAAAGDPAFWWSAPHGTLHLVYPGADRHLHELSWSPAGPVVWRDLTVAAMAPPSDATRPVGYTLPGTSTRCVAYRGADAEVYELRW